MAQAFLKLVREGSIKDFFKTPLYRLIIQLVGRIHFFQPLSRFQVLHQIHEALKVQICIAHGRNSVTFRLTVLGTIVFFFTYGINNGIYKLSSFRVHYSDYLEMCKSD